MFSFTVIERVGQSKLTDVDSGCVWSSGRVGEGEKLEIYAAASTIYIT